MSGAKIAAAVFEITNIEAAEIARIIPSFIHFLERVIAR